MAAFPQPNSQVYKGAYLKAETTAGTFVTPDIRLRSAQTILKPHFETEPFTESGSNVPTVVIPERQWSDLSMSGTVSFTEPELILNGVYAHASATTPTGGTTSKQRIWTPDPHSSPAYDAYSMVVGNPGSNNARKCAGVVLTGLGYTMDIKKWMWDNITGIGQAYNPAATVPVSPTSRVLTPAARPNNRVFSATANDFLTLTQLVGCTKAVFKHDAQRDADWVINADQIAYSQMVDKETKPTLTLSLHQDSTSVAYFTALTASTLVYLQMQALGAIIEAKSPGPGNIVQTIQHQVAGYVSNITEPGPENGVLNWDIEITLVPDVGWSTGFYQEWLTLQAA